MTPLSNAPSSFDAPMNTPSTAETRPSCSSGVTSGTIEPRMYIDTMSAADKHDERDERHHVAVGQAEHHRPGPEHGDHPQQRRPDPTLDRAHGEPDRHQRSPDARRRPQPAVGDVADTETLAGDGRDQCDRTAEQHREQVERDRGQHDRRATDELQALERSAEGRTVRDLLGLADVDDAQHRDDREQPERGGDAVGRRRARRVQEPAEHRPDDRRAGERRRPQGDHLREFLRRTDQRRDRPSGRHHHRIGGAEHEGDQEQRPDDAGVRSAVEQEGDRTGGTTEEEQRRDPPTIEPVGDVSGDQDQQDGGDELGEADQTDVEFVAGDVEHLLEQDRDEDVVADGGERRRTQIATDGGVSKYPSSVGHPGKLSSGEPVVVARR